MPKGLDCLDLGTSKRTGSRLTPGTYLKCIVMAQLLSLTLLRDNSSGVSKLLFRVF